jgi:hypothetical protein
LTDAAILAATCDENGFAFVAVRIGYGTSHVVWLDFSKTNDAVITMGDAKALNRPGFAGNRLV